MAGDINSLNLLVNLLGPSLFREKISNDISNIHISEKMIDTCTQH